MINVNDLKWALLVLLLQLGNISTQWMLKLNLLEHPNINTAIMIVFSVLTIYCFFQIGKRKEKGGVSKCSG